MHERISGAPVSLRRSQERMASSSHIIRLHGPWRCELFKTPNIVAETLTVKLPVDWGSFLLGQNCNSMVWTRSFGRPTNLGERERIELVISDLRADVIVELNEVPLRPNLRADTSTRFELTSRLEVRNRLVLHVRGSTPDDRREPQRSQLNDASAGPFARVYLEIHTGVDRSG